jgi:DNA invertase Pin-like site-specific DNA recombinase
MISARTKAALAAAKARGVKLGNPNGAAPLRRAGIHEVALAVRVANADGFANNIEPIIREIEAAGQTSLRAIAGELNRRRIEARKGGVWHPATVRSLLLRARAA